MHKTNTVANYLAQFGPVAVRVKSFVDTFNHVAILQKSHLRNKECWSVEKCLTMDVVTSRSFLEQNN